MPDIFFPSHFKFMSGIFHVYPMHILSESFGSMPGICLDYSSACQCKSASRSNAIGMRLHTNFGCQGCLMFSAKCGNIRARALAMDPTRHFSRGPPRLAGLPRRRGFRIRPSCRCSSGRQRHGWLPLQRVRWEWQCPLALHSCSATALQIPQTPCQLHRL